MDLHRAKATTLSIATADPRGEAFAGLEGDVETDAILRAQADPDAFEPIYRLYSDRIYSGEQETPRPLLTSLSKCLSGCFDPLAATGRRRGRSPAGSSQSRATPTEHSWAESSQKWRGTSRPRTP